MNNWNIEDLIPHRDRMKLVEEVIDLNDEASVSASVVNDNWPLYNEGSLNPIILIELVAQTAALAVGNKKIEETGKSISGWLVGVKTAAFLKNEVPLGTRLICEVRRKYDRANYAVYTGAVKIGEDLIFETELQLFSPDY